MASTELELKIALDTPGVEAMRRALKAPPDNRLRAKQARPKRQKLRSIYFDTSDQRLAAAKIALRVRRTGGKWVQTVKCGRSLTNGLSRTREYECFVPRPRPQLACIEDADLRRVIDAEIAGAKLIAMFETRMWRDIRVFQAPNGSEVECAIDDGAVVTLGHSAPIREAELELKSGRPSALLTTAEALFDGAPIRPATMNKAQMGYRLRAIGQGDHTAAPGHQTPDAVFALPVSLTPEQSAAQALSCVGREAARQVLGNWDVVRESDTPNGPHQLRVGLRRLRTALRLFRPLTRSHAFSLLDTDARDLSRLVGELRDVDVLLSDIIAPAAAERLTNAQTDSLTRALEDRREQVRKSVRDSLSGGRWTRLRLNCMLFDQAVDRALEPETTSRSMRKNGTAVAPLKRRRRFAQTSVQEVAERALTASWARVGAWGERIDDLTTPERHEMRKDLKKLRYGVEFFSALEEQSSQPKLLKQIKTLQDVFGYLNDVAAAEALPTLLAGPADAGREQPDLAAAATHVIAYHQHRADVAWMNAKSRWEKLAALPKPWERNLT